MMKVRTTVRGERRYDVRLRDPSGRVYTKTFRTRDEATNYTAQERVDQARGQWVDPRVAGTTFAVWAAQWLDSNPSKRVKTKVDDELIVRRHLTPTLGARAVGTITPLHIQRLVSSWVRAAAPATVHRRYATLRAILTSAVDADVIGRSPCRGVKLPPIDIEARRIPTPDELHRLAASIGPAYEAMVYVGAVLGLRIGEVLALRVGRLDLLRGTCTVAESATQVHGRITYGPPKSAAGRRTLAMPPALARMLADHLRRRGLTAANPSALVFVAPEGGPIGYSNWHRRVWVPATKAAGLPGLRFHDLRKVAATAMVTAGVDVRTAQVRLGHSDPRMTLAVYAQATEPADKSAAQVVGELLMPVEPRGAKKRLR
jgi:integrase